MRNNGQELVAEMMGESIKINEFQKIEEKKYQTYACRKMEQMRQEVKARLLQPALALPLLFVASMAHAYPAGVCTSLDAYYKNIPFKAEEFLDLQGAVDFQSKMRGQLVKEQGEEQYFVIYNETVSAPASQYSCAHVEESND